jgi:hypothetical protein
MTNELSSRITSTDPSGATLSVEPLAPTTTSALPSIKFVVFPTSVMILLKHLIQPG